MRALSIMQPWAWLVVNGHKPIENRNWKSWNPGLKFRGEFLIHTGINFDEDFTGIGLPDIVQTIPSDKDLPRGGIVGIAELVDVVTTSDSPWFFGPYGLVLANARPLPFQPCKGALGFFEPDFNSRYKEKPIKTAKEKQPAIAAAPLFEAKDGR